jgi:uncharacterized membrane protein YbhN (UPF0104 family)
MLEENGLRLKESWGKLLLSLLFSLTLFYLLLKNVHPHRLFLYISQAKTGWLALAALIYTLDYGVRGFRVFMATGLPYRISFLVFSTYMCLVRLLPVKLGEVSLPLLLKKCEGTSLVEGTSVLVGIRLLDLSALMTLGTFFLGGLVGVNRWAIMVVSLLPILGVICLSHLKPQIRSSRLGRFVERLAAFGSPALLLSIYGVSLVRWGFNILFFYLVTKSISGSVGLFQVGTAALSSSIVFSLPVNGLGGVGTVDASWAGVLVLLGVAKDVAITSGILANMYANLLSTFIGGGSYLVIRKVCNR